MSKRTIDQMATEPLPGDTLDLWELLDDGSLSHTITLRVMAFTEEYVGYKEYGKGRYWKHLREWKRRIEAARKAEVVFSGKENRRSDTPEPQGDPK